MTLSLYSHPFSSYCQKAKTALYEKGIAFEEKIIDGSEPVASEFATLWPIGKFPVLSDAGRLVFDATGIIEYVEARFPDAPRLIPADPLAAAEVRMWDRFFDNYVATPQQRIIDIALGREHDDGGVRQRGALDTAYALLDARMEGREWVAGNFSMADCAAAPQLLYADWTYAIPKRFAALWAYRDRLLARSSYARALDEARPFRSYFPLGAPEGGIRYVAPGRGPPAPVRAVEARVFRGPGLRRGDDAIYRASFRRVSAAMHEARSMSSPVGSRASTWVTTGSRAVPGG